MISVLDVFTSEKFRSWVTDNESMLALIARQGGSEGLLRSIVGAQFQIANPEHFFIYEKGFSKPKKVRIDLIVFSNEESLCCEFKHNFIHQGIGLVKKSFERAVEQVVEASKCYEHVKKNKEVVLFLVQICAVNQKLPDWAEKYGNNSSSNAEKCIDDIELVKGLSGEVGGITFKLASDGHQVFYLCADDIVKIKLHAFVYRNM